MITKYFTIIILIVAESIAFAESVVVKDGDTISINSRNIRLFGIDAPE